MLVLLSLFSFCDMYPNFLIERSPLPRYLARACVIRLLKPRGRMNIEFARHRNPEPKVQCKSTQLLRFLFF